MGNHLEDDAFIGDIEVIWRRDSNLMVLTKPFSFRSSEDLSGQHGIYMWTAPKGTETDGASIPKILWTFGHPFEAPYRAAAVIHDYECKMKERPWKAVHKMFYRACICGGSSVSRAKAMYWAVYKYGPKWGGYEPRTESSFGGRQETMEMPSNIGDQPSSADLESVFNQLKNEDVPIEQVPFLLP